MGKNKISIALILSIAIVIVVTLLLGAFALLETKSERDERWARLRDDVAMSADQQAVALSLTLWNIDSQPIQAIMRSGMRHREVQAIVLTSPLVKTTLSRDANWNVVVGATPSESLLHDTSLLSERRPIESNGQRLGEVVVYATPRFFEEQLRQRRVVIAVMVLALDCALVASLYALVWMLVLRPLTTIESFASEVAREKAGHPQALQHGTFMGELATLRDSLQNMLAILDRRYQALQDSESRLKLATTAGNIGIWDWDVIKDELVWDEQMYLQYGVRREDFGGAFQAWASTLTPEAFNAATQAMQDSLDGKQTFDAEFTIRALGRQGAPDQGRLGHDT